MKIKNSRVGLWLRRAWSRLQVPLSPVCDDSSRIHSSASFTGHVENIRLGRNVRIGAGARIHCHSNGFVEIGEGTSIGDFVELNTGLPGGKISIGRDCSINGHSIILGHGGCVIGDCALLAPHVMLISFNHRFGNPDLAIATQGLTARGINVARNCWLGAGARILDGVDIGEGSVVGASAVVTRSLPSGSVALGVPARVPATLISGSGSEN